jgi:hypothetical protein
MRAIGPYLATALFALTARDNLWGGYFVYIVLIGFASTTCLMAWVLLDDEPKGNFILMSPVST